MEWISVNKELPKSRTRVLVTDGSTVCIAWLNYHNPRLWEGWTIIDNECFNEVVGWMPLPCASLE